jgi:UDP-N-acetylglucosamine--N-acetylmuramyl-(pentapeptide) pyrophosphoryl-undecaprenol N-acetylglucosamine transferase
MSGSHLMVMAGGTGGHVFPALAVAKELQSSGIKITWLGTKRGLEASVVPANNISIEWVSIEGLRGKGWSSLLMAPLNLARAMWQSAAVIRRVNPDCILGMGGFVSGPGGLVAWLLGRKLVVHEQNAVAGLTNKYLAKIAHRVLTGFPSVVDLPPSALWVGNPVRSAIKHGSVSSQNSINILVIGGSQGAHSFNQKLPQVFAQLSQQNINIWHQSGRERSADVEQNYLDHELPAKVTEFIDDMAEAYRWADLLVCRAGAMTIAECCAAAKPALLIPFPFSAGDHQQYNAQTLVDIGAARTLANEKIDQPEMLAVLNELLADKAALVQMGLNAATLNKPNAVRDVANICRELLNA